MKRFISIAFALSPAPGLADPPVVTAATAQHAAGHWTISVTLSHPDTGWDHYADGWEVLAPNGTRLGYRELLHPHETEQPFTRSLGGIAVPEGIGEVLIRARCSLDGWNEGTTAATLD